MTPAKNADVIPFKRRHKPTPGDYQGRDPQVIASLGRPRLAPRDYLISLGADPDDVAAMTPGEVLTAIKLRTPDPFKSPR